MDQAKGKEKYNLGTITDMTESQITARPSLFNKTPRIVSPLGGLEPVMEKNVDKTPRAPPLPRMTSKQAAL